MLIKRLLICAAAVFLFTVSGCGKNIGTEESGIGPFHGTGATEAAENGMADAFRDTAEPGSESAAENQMEQEKKQMGNPVDSGGATELKSIADTSYQVSMEKTEDENINISYPKLSGWKLEDIQNQWNRYFKERADELAADLTENDYVETIYEITEQEEGLLSVIKVEGVFQDEKNTCSG